MILNHERWTTQNGSRNGYVQQNGSDQHNIDALDIIENILHSPDKMMRSTCLLSRSCKKHEKVADRNIDYELAKNCDIDDVIEQDIVLCHCLTILNVSIYVLKHIS